MTLTGADLQAFARLIESLTPWLDQVVISHVPYDRLF
jgi:hypothetical protein